MNYLLEHIDLHYCMDLEHIYHFDHKIVQTNRDCIHIELIHHYCLHKHRYYHMDHYYDIYFDYFHIIDLKILANIDKWNLLELRMMSDIGLHLSMAMDCILLIIIII